VGSGASGVIAYQLNPRTGEEIALTTMGIERYNAKPPVFYNQFKLQRYTEQADIRLIVNWLLRHGAHVERWIPKATIGDRAFDIRQLVVDGGACHAIARVSRTPITNLHLRSERMQLGELGLPASMIAAVRHSAEQALKAFPRSRIAGMDVLLDQHSGRMYIADVNPFGDLLYNVAYKGFGAYEWEMKRLDECSRIEQR